LSFQQNS